MTEKNRTVLLVLAGIISGCLLTMSVCAIRKSSLTKRNRKSLSNRNATNSVTDSEKFHFNVAAGASVSIPITAKGDIDINLASNNGDKSTKAVRGRVSKCHDNSLDETSNLADRNRISRK